MTGFSYYVLHIIYIYIALLKIFQMMNYNLMLVHVIYK
jgi:hypothetical protein